MTVPDPHPPRRAQEPSHRSLLIANLGFMVVAVVGALAGGVIQDLRWHGSLAKPEGQLDLAERAFQSGNEQVALMLFTKLAGQNNPVAEYWLAHMTELGLGLARDPAKAIGLYQKAAAQNVVPAQQRLGEIYLDGNLVPPDFMQAKTTPGRRSPRSRATRSPSASATCPCAVSAPMIRRLRSRAQRKSSRRSSARKRERSHRRRNDGRRTPGATRRRQQI